LKLETCKFRLRFSAACEWGRRGLRSQTDHDRASPKDWRRRFAAFAVRKEHEAQTVPIPPLTTEFERRGASGLVAIGSEWTRRLFDGPFYASVPRDGSVPATNLVFVQSRSGNTVAKDPSLIGGGEADRHLIYEGLSRVAADAVMAGAETIRDGRIVMSIWHPELVALRESLGLPRHPIQIVATLRGLAFDGVLFNVPELRVVVLTVPLRRDSMITELAARPWITPIVMPSARDLPHAFRQLHQTGIRRISCIGGRTLAGQLLDARLVQDLYLTTSPKEAGEPNTPLSAKPIDAELIVRKHGTGSDSGVVFEHLRLRA
jgi:5-amino-6-(5-phosphoribosylamino)uracil reductase